jgi:hypothetical protein
VSTFGNIDARKHWTRRGRSSLAASAMARAAVPGPGLPVLLVLLLFPGAGCTIDAPQAPQFETQVFLPLGPQTTTGEDLIDEDGYVQADSARAGSLRFVLHGSMERVEVGTLLDMEPPASSFSFGFDEVSVVSALPLRSLVPFRSISGQISPLAREGQLLVVDPFAIPAVSQPLSSPENIEWARLVHGRLQFTLRNYLPVPMGDASHSAASVRLRDRNTGAVLFTSVFAQPIAPGDMAVATASLAGVEMSRDIDLELWGYSPGSGGVPVEVRADEQVIDVEVVLADLAADSVYASVPAQTASTAGTVALAEDVDLVEGAVRSGILHVAFENPYPFPGSGQLTLPSVHRAGADDPLLVDLDLPAMRDGVPGRGEVRLDLAGCVVGPTSGPERALEYRADLATPASDGPVRFGAHRAARLTLDPGRLCFDSIRGRLEQRRLTIPATETRIDPPEGLDSLSFEGATLGLTITSTVAFPAEAELRVTGVSGGGSDSIAVPLRFPIPAAVDGVARVTRVSMDETNSNILDLLGVRPRKLLVAGVLRVGAGEEGTIRRTDWTSGEYTLSAPLRVRIGRITHRTDPSSVVISRQDQERIRENVRDATARGTVTNHFPVGVEVRLLFAGSEADLALDSAAHPDRVLALDPVAVAPAETDPATGLVVRSRETPLEVAIRSDQVSFFARDTLFVQTVLAVSGEDPQRTVELTSLDYVDVAAILDFRVWVKQ